MMQLPDSILPKSSMLKKKFVIFTSKKSKFDEIVKLKRHWKRLYFTDDVKYANIHNAKKTN